MIHRFVDLLAGLPDCAYVVSADDGSNFWKSIWVAGHGFTPRELVGTRLDTFSLGRQFGSPTVSPDRTKVLYSTVPADGSINTLDVRGVNDSGHVQIASYANANAGGVDKGLQGSWHPDGTKVVYVESVGAADTSQWIRSVNIDGTGDTGLYSNNRSANGYAMFPAYNYDGSRIAFYKVGDTLWTMLADGTGATQFDSRTAFTETPIAWANTQDVLAWEDTGAVYKKANGDGTGITTLWTDPNPFWGNTRFAWLPDDSGLIVLRRVPADPDPKFILTVIDAAGGEIGRAHV